MIKYSLADVREDISTVIEFHRARWHVGLEYRCLASGCRWKHVETIKGDVHTAHAEHVADEVIQLLADIGSTGPLVS